MQEELKQRTRQAEAEQQRAQQLARLSAEFQTVLDAAPDRITCLDRDLRLTWANRAAARVAGLEIGEMVGQPCYRVFFHLEDICPNCPVERSFRTGQQEQDRMADRAGRTWDLRTAPILAEDGRIIGVIEVGRDITQSLHLEEQIQQTQKMEAIGQLAGGVAHDFNNIVSAIIGFAELALMDLAGDSPLHTPLQQILEAAHRARVLTQSLLVFSRRKPVALKREDLNRILTKFQPILRRLLREDIDLRVQPCPGELWIEADQTQIEQVIMNLTTNARDAMPQGGTITLSTTRLRLDPALRRSMGLPDTPEQALLACTDTGTGIPESLRAKIFEPFFTTKAPGKGTGLGLPTVYGIVQQHHGHLTWHSETGKGTEFRVYLPICPSTAAAETAPAPAARPLPRGRETILLAEDFPNMRAVTKAVLTRFGYRVLEAADGVEALDLFQREAGAIDLVLLDGIMPRKNGLEVFKAIRATHPHQKILFMTGYIDELASLDQLADPKITVLQKPVAPSLLLNKVRELLDEGT